MEEDADVLPHITPCLFGREVSMHQDIVHSGLAAISLKRPKSSSRESSNLTNRNTFWNIHHPDLEQLNFKPSVSNNEIEEFFHAHSNHGSHCNLLHQNKNNRDKRSDDELKEILPPTYSKYDEDPLNENISTPTFSLSDTDLDEEMILHRCPAVFCVTIGQIAPLNSMTLRGNPVNAQQNKQESHPQETRPSTSKGAQKENGSKIKNQIPTLQSNIAHEQIINGKTGKMENTNNTVTNTDGTDSETGSDSSPSSDFSSTFHQSARTIDNNNKIPSNSALHYSYISSGRPLNSPKSAIDLLKSPSLAFVSKNFKDDENEAEQNIYELITDTHSGDLITILEPREDHRDSEPQPFAGNFPPVTAGANRGRSKLLERPHLD